MSDVLDMPGCDSTTATSNPPPSKVITLPCLTKLDINPDTVLRNNVGRLEGVLLLGFDKDGEEIFASSYADGGTALWLLERCKKMLLEDKS